MTTKIWNKNPFRIPFFAVAVICCVVMSIVFYFISVTNQKELRTKQTMEKAEMCMEDWESQLDQMKGIALRLASNYEFQPGYFRESLDREWDMLDSFTQYSYHSALADEYFLDYGEGRVYLSSGHTQKLDLFLKMKSDDHQQWDIYNEELKQVRENLTEICGDPEVRYLFDHIFVLIPFRAGRNDENAILGFVVKNRDLEERLRVASGGLQGCVTLYNGETVIYCNQEETCTAGQRGVVSADSWDGSYRLCYQPEKDRSTQTSVFFLQLLLVLADMALVFVVANIFAERSYKPIRTLADTYREKTYGGTDSSENALEELKSMMDQMLQSNQISNLQIQENQKILRNQVLKMIVNGSVTEELESYLERAQINLPGPVYFAISISYAENVEATDEFLRKVQEELVQIPEETERDFIYTICNTEKKLINVICSIRLEEETQEFVETICDVAESFAMKPQIGVGTAYHDLHQLSASWLESMDNIQSGQKASQQPGNEGVFDYQAENVRWITEALEDGSKNVAIQRLNDFVHKLKERKISFLMQRYIISDFLGEMRRLEEKYQIKMSTQTISYLVAAKDMENFGVAAKNMITEYFKGYEAMKLLKEDGNMLKICEYIREHFTEYDISSENIAEHFHVSKDVVRQAVLSQTGMLYRDYLIHLRIEYAKVLLRQENIPVAELCQKIGYGNVSYFIKLFKEITGETPAKYRKNVLGQ